MVVYINAILASSLKLISQKADPLRRSNCHRGTKTQSESRNFLVNIHLCVLVPWWRKSFGKPNQKDGMGI